MSRKLFLVLALMLLTLAVLPVQAQDEFVFGLVLVGPKNDGGWSQAHYEGGLYVEQNIPGARMLVFESLNTTDSPEATLEGVAREMIDQGARLIITTSDAFATDTDVVASLYPDVVFINVSGSNRLDIKAYDVFPGLIPTPDALPVDVPQNVGNVMASMEWGRIIAGCAAALATDTGQIGYIGPLINAETRRLSASAYLGARYCYENYRQLNPNDLQFTITWIGFWFNIPNFTLDPTEEVNKFFDNGADVVISGIDTTENVAVAGQRAAQGDRVFSIAYNSISGCNISPETCLGVAYYNWGPTYAGITAKVLDGTWVPTWDLVGPDWDDPATSIVGFQYGSALTDEMQVSLDAFIAEAAAFAADPLHADQIFLWQGPLALQSGLELAADGQPVDLLKIWYLPELLQGMIGASN